MKSILRAFIVLALALIVGVGATCRREQTPAPTPSNVVGHRDAAQAARDSWTAAHLDAWLARVPDLTKPDQITAMLGIFRAANPVTPTPDDLAGAQATVAAVAAGNLKAAEDAVKISGARVAILSAALAAEKSAREKAEAALADERATSAQKIKDLEAKWSNNFRLLIARVLGGAGVLVILASAALMWALGATAWKKVAGGVLVGLLLIGCGLIVGHEYFVRSFVVTLFIGGIVAYFVYRHTRETSLIEQGVRRAVQDGKDEAKLGIGNAKAGYEWLVEHLTYRFPRKANQKNPIEAVIDQRNAAEGINAAS